MVMQSAKDRVGMDTSTSFTPTQEEMVNVIEWADLQQLQLLRKIAESIEKEPLHINRRA